MDAFENNQDLDYLTHIEMLWSFIKNFLIDRENGEWFWRVNEDNIPISTEDKLGFWKCPYHNGRALMELIERIDKMTDKS
jgi:mannobiose 2-epimerase